MTGAPVRYTPDVEHVQPDEAETQKQLIEAFRGIIDTTNKDFGHAYRSVHAKSHALLEGTLTVRPDLPAELAQGVFRDGGKTFPVLLRISTNAGDPLPDTISLPRGMALKIIGVEGDRLPGSEGDVTQDFVMAVGTSFQAPDARHFLSSLKLLAGTTDKAEGGKVAISALLRGANTVLEAVGIQSPKVKSLGGYPQTHPLGERYFSQVPIRWGNHIAKVGVVPLSPNFKALEGQQIDVDGRDDALREDLAAYLTQQGGAFELRVQLARDLAKNPVEDASVPWPEDDNPYVAVATIEVPAQSSWTWDRAKVIDDETSFSPWHGITAHQPLGNIMRARKPTYEDSSTYRARLNGCPIHHWREAPKLEG